MKVAFDARELSAGHPPAGIGQYIRGLFSSIDEFHSRKVQLTALVDKDRNIFPDNKNIQLKTLEEQYSGKLSKTFWEIFRMGRAIDETGVDIFHSTAHIGFGTERTPMVLTVHDATNFLFPKWYNFTNQINRSYQLKRSIKEAHSIIAVSEATRGDICKLFPEAEKKTCVVYEGADPIFRPHEVIDRKALGLDFDGAFILWVGTTSPRKNLKGLLQALDKLHKNGSKYHLVMLGQRGWKDSPIFEFILERGLEKYIHSLGYQPWEMLPHFYSACSLFIFPSLYEGFGLPVLEAMSCGAPTLASNTSSLPEIIPTEEALFDPGNPEEMAEKIKWVMESGSVQQVLSNAGRLKAETFSWQRAAEETVKVYEGVGA